MTNPTIQNVGLVSRNDRFAVVSHCVVDGASIAADGVLLRGTVLVKNTSGATTKWHPYVHDTDTVALDQTRILQDDTKVQAAQDAFVAAYLEGFFTLSSIVDANSANGLLASDLLLAAGFHQIEVDEVRLK